MPLDLSKSIVEEALRYLKVISVFCSTQLVDFFLLVYKSTHKFLSSQLYLNIRVMDMVAGASQGHFFVTEQCSHANSEHSALCVKSWPYL